jgi:translation initiation factor 1
MATTNLAFNTFGRCCAVREDFAASWWLRSSRPASSNSTASIFFFLTFASLSKRTDAFEDAGDKGGTSHEDKVHVRVQQRNGRKCITTVAGLADDLDIKRICKAFKKNFSCNGAVQKDEEAGEVIQLSGDQRTNVKDFLVDQEICHADSVVLHGF